jgi:hypothetical protein
MLTLPELRLDREVELTEARILKISKDDLRMDENQILWSEELEQEVVNYWTTLNKYWTDKRMPPCSCADREGGSWRKRSSTPISLMGSPVQ